MDGETLAGIAGGPAVVEQELESRIENLKICVDRLPAGNEEQELGGMQEPNHVNDLRTRLKAMWNMVRVAKLLREPARGSMLATVQDSLKEMEESVAAEFGVRVH
jgi:hypothetical protein